ncbi:unnamed protein product [Caenorhabditis nigoni]
MTIVPMIVFREATQSRSIWMAILAVVTLFASLFVACYTRNRWFEYRPLYQCSLFVWPTTTCLSKWSPCSLDQCWSPSLWLAILGTKRIVMSE